MKKAAVLAFSKKGCALALRLSQCLTKQGYSCWRYAPEKYAEAGYEAEEGSLADKAFACEPIVGGIAAFTGPLMQEMDALIFVGACGIAVRSIAPYVKSKTHDPAVLCVDELGKYVISLLSGHIGGGNRLTHMVAEGIGGMPVITTATDINGRFSVDAWAAEHGFAIGSMAIAKDISAAILERDLPICADVEMEGELPFGLYAGSSGPLGICLSYRQKRVFGETLLLIPKVLTLGVGCRRGTAPEAIEAVVRDTLKQNGLDFRGVKDMASITLKSDEEGLLAFADRYRLPIQFYPPRELAALPGSFTPSAFVSQTVGVDNVCERSAVMKGSRLIVEKTAVNGVTVAVAEAPWRVCF